MNLPEEALHRAVLAYLRASLPKPWLVFHVPNGGGRSKAEAGVLKAMGVLAGIPDLLVFGPGATQSATTVVAIELKAPPRRLRSGGLSKATPRLSPAQSARRLDLGACGVPYVLSDDLADVVQQLRALGVPLRGRVL